MGRSWLFQKRLTHALRTEPRIWAGLTAYQFGAAGLGIVMAILWLKDERLKRTLEAEAALRA